MHLFKKLLIKEVRRETPSAVSILFNIPDELRADYTFVAGQYVNLKLTLDGKEIRRAYSICSSPESGELRIAIKAVPNGLFSQFANSTLKAGDVLEVAPPEGKFTFKPDSNRQRNYAAFAAGSGITPILSVVNSVLVSEPQSTVVLVYGNKSLQETIFYQQLHDLQRQYTGRFFVHFIYSQTQSEGVTQGRIDKSVVEAVLYNMHAALEFEKYYLCGPEPMISTVSKVLQEHHVKESKIKFELFSSSASKIVDVSTPIGHSTITITVDAADTTFEMSQKQTILEAALKQGLDAPYSCQGGICSSCLARIKSGTAAMKKNAILTDDEINSGLILTCQAHPTSAEIVIDYDDV